MIEPRELRIGNLVQAFGKTVEVIAIEKAGIAHKHDDLREVYAAQDYLSPIPLTEEILRKMGFENHKDWQNTWLWKDGFGMNFHNGKWMWNNLTKRRVIESVHELQNLYFFLTGQELTYTP